MKQGRFSEQQIIGILKQNEAGAPVPRWCREHGIRESTFYKWKSKYGGLEVNEAKRLLKPQKPPSKYFEGGFCFLFSLRGAAR